jgi:hypothetical protein
MRLPALPELRLTASLIAHAGYLPATGAAFMTTAAACAAFVLLSRKRIAWDTRLDMPAGLALRHAALPGAGQAGDLILGEPGLHYPGPWTSGIQHGWLVVLSITNPGPSAIRSGDFSTPLTFAFPGRQVCTARLVPEPADRNPGAASRMPAVRAPAQGGPAAGHAGPDTARLELTGDFLFRPGDSYSLLLVLTGTPAGKSRVRHEGSLTRGKIIPPG